MGFVKSGNENIPVIIIIIVLYNSNDVDGLNDVERQKCSC